MAGAPFLADSPCCVSCHFAWEEANVLPLLPDAIAAQILRAHAAIRRLNFSPYVVEEHGRWELELMRKYCPEDVCAMVEKDHQELEAMCPEWRWWEKSMT